MLELASSLQEPDADLTFAFYVCEEVAREHNGLSRLFALRPDLLAGDVAILGEPTDGAVEAGCQGVLKVSVTLHGERAHTARPWMGLNAIHRLGPLLESVARFGGREPVVDGCRYREALQAVQVSGGVAANVVPDVATVLLNHRFAPDRDGVAAMAALTELIGPFLDRNRGDAAELVEMAPAAAPGLNHPVLARLVEATGRPPRAKLGWTDVALFAERGIPATNFGPGDPTLAHTAGERVQRADIERVFRVLSTLAGG
jgi:succinyl-diaminopimelate desuccinylase